MYYVIRYANRPEFKGTDLYLTPDGETSSKLEFAETFLSIPEAVERHKTAVRPVDRAHYPGQIVGVGLRMVVTNENPWPAEAY